MKKIIKLVLVGTLLVLFLSGSGYQTGLTELNLLIPETPVIYAQVGGLGSLIQDVYGFINKIGLSTMVAEGSLEQQIDALLKQNMAPLTYSLIDSSKPLALSVHSLNFEVPKIAVYIPIISPSTNVPILKAGLEKTLGSADAKIFGRGSYLVIHSSGLKFSTSSLNNAAYLTMYRERNFSVGVNVPELMRQAKKEGLWDTVTNEFKSDDVPGMTEYWNYLEKLLGEAKDLVFNVKADTATLEGSMGLSWISGGTLDGMYSPLKKGDLDSFMNYLPRNALVNYASIDSGLGSKEYFDMLNKMIMGIDPQSTENKAIMEFLKKFEAFALQLRGGSSFFFDPSLDASKITADLFPMLESEDDNEQLQAADKLVSAIKLRSLSVMKFKDKVAIQKAFKEIIIAVQKAADSVKDESGVKLSIVTGAPVKSGTVSIDEIKIAVDAKAYMNNEGIKQPTADKAQAIINRFLDMLTVRVAYEGDLMYLSIGIPSADLGTIIKNKKIDGITILEQSAVKATYDRNPVNVLFAQFQFTPIMNIASVLAPAMIKPIKDGTYPGIFMIASTKDKTYSMDMILTTDEIKYYYSTYSVYLPNLMSLVDSLQGSSYDDPYYYDDEGGDYPYEGDDWYYEE